MLPPLGIIFGLLVGFIAVQVWSDFDRAKVAIATEASALRAIGESIHVAFGQRLFCGKLNYPSEWRV